MHVSSRNMFPTTRNLQIRVHVYRPRHCCGDWLTFGCFIPMIVDHDLVKKRFGPMIADHDLVKINNHECWDKHAHIPDNDYWGILSVSCRVNQFFFSNYSYVVHTEYIFIFFHQLNIAHERYLPERVQILGHAHILCITVRENRIMCCQIFCDLLLKSAFERMFNVMQLILVKIKWHNKWKYLIQKFHDICLSYYFKSNSN
jgi:hypothetical protein